MKEIWRDVDGYNGDYQVSNYGRVRSFKRSKKGVLLKDKAPSKRDYRISLRKDNHTQYVAVHRLVAAAFLKRIDGKTCVNHIDGNPKNNHVNNLEWCNHSENVIHAVITGLTTHNHNIILSYDGREYRFVSKVAASKWLGRSHSYITNRMIAGADIVRCKKGNLYKIVEVIKRERNQELHQK